MKSAESFTAQDMTVCCRVAAGAAMRTSAEMIALARRQPMVVAGRSLPASFLRHSEDQTIVALQAMLRALEGYAGRGELFADWGVLAAPTFLGRLGTAQTIEQFQREGAWGVSPHLIPHHSLHGLSGTISQALKIHGPNFGVSGGPRPHAEGFLLTATLLAEGRVPGVWLVLTGHEKEFIPSSAERLCCCAMVLALTAAAESSHGPHLWIKQRAAQKAAQGAMHEVSGSSCPLTSCAAPFTLSAFTDQGALPGGIWQLTDSLWIELETVNLLQEVPA